VESDDESLGVLLAVREALEEPEEFRSLVTANPDVTSLAQALVIDWGLPTWTAVALAAQGAGAIDDVDREQLEAHVARLCGAFHSRVRVSFTATSADDQRWLDDVAHRCGGIPARPVLMSMPAQGYALFQTDGDAREFVAEVRADGRFRLLAEV
jgi:hypothetical protein